jgi:hypothetical protein
VHPKWHPQRRWLKFESAAAEASDKKRLTQRERIIGTQLIDLVPNTWRPARASIKAERQLTGLPVHYEPVIDNAYLKNKLQGYGQAQFPAGGVPLELKFRAAVKHLAGEGQRAGPQDLRR